MDKNERKEERGPPPRDSKGRFRPTNKEAQGSSLSDIGDLGEIPPLDTDIDSMATVGSRSSGGY